MKEQKLHVYQVGILRDIRQKGFLTKRFWYWFKTSWKRKSYWNGYLAEPEVFPAGVHKCGKGWTKKQAVRSYWRNVRKASHD